jgi:hypothetical protein
VFIQHSAFSRNMDLPTSVAIGRRLVYPLPQGIETFAIEAQDVVTFEKHARPT